MEKPTFLAPYIHKDIYFVDRRIFEIREFKNIEIKSETNTYLYEAHYKTNLIKIFEMGNALDTNVFHIFVFMLARLYFIDNGTADVFFYYPKSDNYLIETAFKLLDKRFKRLTDKFEHYEYIELPGCKWYYDSVGDDWLYPYLKDLYKPIWADVKMEKGKRIYISRAGAKVREVSNEDALVEPLKILGFSIYNLEHMSFNDQIKLFASAELITGPHGAGLTWTLFANTEATLLEINLIRTAQDGGLGKNHYYDLANKMNIRYYRFTECVVENNNFIVNIPVYINTIKELIKSQQS